jgi:hypothetical protein
MNTKEEDILELLIGKIISQLFLAQFYIGELANQFSNCCLLLSSFFDDVDGRMAHFHGHHRPFVLLWGEQWPAADGVNGWNEDGGNLDGRIRWRRTSMIVGLFGHIVGHCDGPLGLALNRGNLGIFVAAEEDDDPPEVGPFLFFAVGVIIFDQNECFWRWIDGRGKANWIRQRGKGGNGTGTRPQASIKLNQIADQISQAPPPPFLPSFLPEGPFHCTNLPLYYLIKRRGLG